MVGANDADVAKDAVGGTNVIEVAALDVVAKEAVAGVNVIAVATDAVVANDELIALLAQLDVPINVPVNEPVNDPVFICVELLTVPVGKNAVT